MSFGACLLGWSLIWVFCTRGFVGLALRLQVSLSVPFRDLPCRVGSRDPGLGNMFGVCIGTESLVDDLGVYTREFVTLALCWKVLLSVAFRDLPCRVGSRGPDPARFVKRHYKTNTQMS